MIKKAIVWILYLIKVDKLIYDVKVMKFCKRHKITRERFNYLNNGYGYGGYGDTLLKFERE